MQSTGNEGFNQWALVEIMGHQRIAGHVTEQEIGGQKFVRVDVPAEQAGVAITKFYGAGAIYALTPVSEETARAMARQIDAKPISVWDARRLVQTLAEPKLLDAQESESDEADDEQDEDTPGF